MYGVGRLVNKKMERMWMEEVVAYFKLLLGDLAAGTGEREREREKRNRKIDVLIKYIL
jgi:hypothetical protein